MPLPESLKRSPGRQDSDGGGTPEKLDPAKLFAPVKTALAETGFMESITTKNIAAVGVNSHSTSWKAPNYLAYGSSAIIVHPSDVPIEPAGKIIAATTDNGQLFLNLSAVVPGFTETINLISFYRDPDSSLRWALDASMSRIALPPESPVKLGFHGRPFGWTGAVDGVPVIALRKEDGRLIAHFTTADRI